MSPAVHATAPIVECVGLVKVYGAVLALDGADLALFRGEVLGVVGDNGSGKTTLIKCLSGAEHPDAGVIRLNGADVFFRTSNDARRAGINTVYQSLAVEPALDLANSLFRGHALDRPGHVGTIEDWLEKKGVRKRAKGLASNVILLDEPTAALGERESLRVLKLIDNLRSRGLPIVVTSHNLAQVAKVADRIHVQRLGKRAAVVAADRFDGRDIAAIMSGALVVGPEDEAQGPIR